MFTVSRRLFTTSGKAAQVCQNDTPDDGSFHGRLQRAARRRGIATANKLSDLLGVSATGPTKWWGGRALPDVDNLTKIVLALGVDGHWLLTGQGEMERRPVGEAEHLLAEIRRLLGEPLEEPVKYRPATGTHDDIQRPAPRKGEGADRKRA